MAGQLFSTRVTDITYQKILPSIVDEINNSTVFTCRVLTKPESWEGIYMTQPVRTGNSTTGGSFAGMDTWPTAAVNNTQQMTWYVSMFEQSVVIPGIERAINSTSDRQAVKLVADQLDQAKISAIQALSPQFYGYGTGKDQDGLGLIIDNGTNTASYAGITRSGNSWINGDVTAVSGGRITLDYLSSEFDNISAAGSVQESPTLGLTTKAIWTYIESIMQPMMSARYDTLTVKGYDRVDGGLPPGQLRAAGAATTGFAGFNALNYRARGLVADDACTTGTFFWINEHYLEYRRLKDSTLKQIDSTVEVTDGMYKDLPLPSAFQFRDFMSPVNQYGEVAALILIGNVIHRQPRRNGKLTGITGN